MARLPFANGTEYCRWTERNCERCARYAPEAEVGDREACPIEEAIMVASLTGEFEPEIAARMGWAGEMFPGPCKEWAPAGPRTQVEESSCRGDTK